MKASPATDLSLIRLGPEHIGAAHLLSVKENWPHRQDEWAMVLDLGTGFGLMTEGRLVGTAVLMPYGVDGATCNMIIVDDSMRGLGLGRRLMEALV